jgi:hypothetical protein
LGFYFITKMVHTYVAFSLVLITLWARAHPQDVLATCCCHTWCKPWARRGRPVVREIHVAQINDEWEIDNNLIYYIEEMSPFVEVSFEKSGSQTTKYKTGTIETSSRGSKPDSKSILRYTYP